jgi:hypothetical protein
MERARLPTGCEALDLAADGGLVMGTISQLFGEKGLGKSILSLQAACSAVARGRSAVVLDTEQSYASSLIPYWLERLARRFSCEVRLARARLERSPRGARKKVTRTQLITALAASLNGLGLSYTEEQLRLAADALSSEVDVSHDASPPCLLLLEVPEVLDLLALHGVDAALEVTAGGRVDIRLKHTPLLDSPLRRLVRELGASLLVYDSLSSPFKGLFGATQSLPARSAALAMVLSHAQKLCSELGLAVLAVSHASINPTQPFDRRPYGGIILGHESKFVFELCRPEARRLGEAEPLNPSSAERADRVLWVCRHPALRDYSRFGYVRIDEGGIY